ncbi:hypothetical protein L7F22_028797 [Adiantum nelumboides]|nr:hypothetical protein [Adiantum nelumboides]
MAFLRGSKFAAPWRTCMRGPCAALPRFPANHPSSAHASIATAAPKFLTEEEDTLATSLQLESSNATNHDAVIHAFHDPAHAGGPSYPRAKRTLAASTAAPSLAVQALACPLMVSNQPLPCQPLPVGDPAAEGGITTSLFDGRGAIVIAPHVGAAFLEDEVVHPITVDSSYSFLDSVAAAPALQNFVANVLPAANEESAAHIGATLKAAEAIVITTAANDASTFLPHKPAFAEGPFLCSSIWPCKDGASSNSFCVQYAAIQPPQANQVPSANAGGIDVSIIINATSAHELLLSHQLALRLAANSVAIPIEAATSSNRLLPPTSIFNKKPTLRKGADRPTSRVESRSAREYHQPKALEPQLLCLRAGAMPLHGRVVVSACFVLLLTLIFVLCARPISALASNETSSWSAAEILHMDHHMLAWRLRQSSAYSMVFQPWRIVGGLLCGSLATALSSAGGIGGGGLYVPIFNLILGFDSKTSAALSSCMIMGGTLVNIFWYAFQKDASGLGPLVDYEVVLLCLPNVLLGISIGVMCNVAAPSWLVTVLLIFVLFFMTFRSCRNAIQRWNVESSYSVQSELLIRLNLPNDKATCDREDALFPPSSNFASASHLHRKLSKDEDLEMPLLGSHLSETKPQFPSVKIAMLCLIWIAFLAVQLVRGSSDGQNFFGIETCGTIFWIVTLVQLPLAMVITALVLFHFQRRTKFRGNAASDEAVSLMESGSRTLFPVYALVAGFLGGMLGLGGGMIISPLFLEMGMHPQTTAATCSYMVFFSSSLSVVQFWLLGRIPQLYALASACVALVFSVTGILVIHAVISKYGRVSLIVFSVSTVMAISAVMMACFGTWDVIEQIEQNAYMGFRSPC